MSVTECLLWLAGTLSTPKLLMLAMEFAGTYARDPRSEEYCYGIKPFLTINDLRERIGQLDYQHSSRPAAFARALQWSEDKSASVMESAMYLLNELPYRHGGYGFVGGLLNPFVDEEGNVCEIRKPKCLRPDIYYPKARLALEYNSTMFHCGIDDYARDSDRAEGLRARNIEVISVTPNKLYDVNRYEKIIHILAKRAGRRLNPPEGFEQRRDELRAQILPRLQDEQLRRGDEL